MTESIRLSKAVAEQLTCSRREAELLIESGCVSVAGHIIEIPEHRVPADPSVAQLSITRKAHAITNTPVTVLYHKPSGQACWDEQVAQAEWLHTENHATTDRSGIRLLRKHLKGMVCVAPLEPAASGLVVFTQDFRIQRKLVADRAQLENEVMVEVQAVLTSERIAAIVPAGMHNAPFKVSMASQSAHTTQLRFAIKGNTPGRLATICQAHGWPIVGMKRQRIGRLGLTGLPVGQWRFLMPYERF